MGAFITLIFTDKTHRKSQMCRPRDSPLLSSRLDDLSEQYFFVLCIWLIDLTFGALKSSEIRQSGEHDIEVSANPGYILTIPLHGNLNML